MEGRNIQPSAGFGSFDNDMKPTCPSFKQKDEMAFTVLQHLTMGQNIREHLERFDRNPMLMNRFQNIVMRYEHLLAGGSKIGHDGRRNLRNHHFLPVALIDESLPVDWCHQWSVRPSFLPGAMDFYLG